MVKISQVTKVSRSDKVSVPHPEYFAVTAPKDDSNDDDIFICFHRNIKIINKIVSEVATETPPTSCH